MFEQYISFTIDNGTDVKRFIKDKLDTGYTFYSLYGERFSEEAIECRTFTLTQGETLDNFITNLLSNLWEIKSVTFLEGNRDIE